MKRKKMPLRLKRDFFFPNLAEGWLKIQTFPASHLGSLVSNELWPEVDELFFNEEVTTGLNSVIRWQKFLAYDIRQQTCQEHAISLAWLASSVIGRLNGQGKKFDRELVEKTCLLHNVAKGLSGRDVSYQARTETDDVREWQIFNDFCQKKDLPAESLAAWKKIYLLQFCLKKVKIFPDNAQPYLTFMRENYRQEALLFQALEALDFIFFAEEQYVRRGENFLLLEVAHQLPLLGNLTKRLNGLEKIWTPQAKKHFKKLSS